MISDTVDLAMKTKESSKVSEQLTYVAGEYQYSIYDIHNIMATWKICVILSMCNRSYVGLHRAYIHIKEFLRKVYQYDRDYNTVLLYNVHFDASRKTGNWNVSDQ